MTLTLCDDRRRILDAKGHILVTGGPGSGKTTIALAKAEKRINDGLLPGESVLFLSFSRAAVGRIIEASKTQIPAVRRSQLSIQTFHSFFWEIIRAHGYLLGAPRNLKILLPHDVSVLRDGLQDENADWTTAREKLFTEEGLVTFDLFAAKVHELFAKSKYLRNLFASRHPLIVVDEAQDTAEDQWQTIRQLAENVQLVCLADLEQQIYDFRPGVSSERVTQIMEALNPLRVDLRGQNHRSPDSEIVTFGNDILLVAPRGTGYRGVSRKKFKPSQKGRDAAIRSSVGMISAKITESVGVQPENIAILTTWNRGVGIVSRALTGDGAKNLIPHRVMIDQAPILLSSRLVAFLMEPRRGEELLDLEAAINLVGSVYRAKGGTTGLKQAQKLAQSALECTQGKIPKKRSVAARLLEVLQGLRAHTFSGDPKRDWIETRRRLRDSASTPLAYIASQAEQLIVFQRGQRIAMGLTELWQTQGNYAGARKVLDVATTEDQLLSGGEDLRGIHVMTIHKSKGKEFDAVVILDDSNNSPLNFCQEGAPFLRSRKLLRVGITRARHHVLMLTDLYRPSELLQGHEL